MQLEIVPRRSGRVSYVPNYPGPEDDLNYIGCGSYKEPAGVACDCPWRMT
jgi:hypothetical protein